VSGLRYGNDPTQLKMTFQGQFLFFAGFFLCIAKKVTVPISVAIRVARDVDSRSIS